jgi:hypothetical protein
MLCPLSFHVVALRRNRKLNYIKFVKAQLALCHPSAIAVHLFIIFGLLTPRVISAFASSIAPVGILLAIGILFPLGLFMGMAFPLGLKMSTGKFDALMPAFWGVNGAASICSSILAMVIAMDL